MSAFRVGEMVQWMKVFAADRGGLSSIPKTHMVEGENWRQ